MKESRVFHCGNKAVPLHGKSAEQTSKTAAKLPSLLHEAVFFVVPFRAPVEGDSSDILAKLCRIDGTGQIANLSRDAPKMEFKYHLFLLNDEFGHEVDQIFIHFFPSEQKPVGEVDAGDIGLDP